MQKFSSKESIGKAPHGKKNKLTHVRVEPSHLPRDCHTSLGDCVTMHIDTKSMNKSAFRLIVSLSFGTADVAPRYFGGRVRFGLKNAKLRLLAKDCRVMREGRWPEYSSLTSIAVEVEVGQRLKRACSTSTDLKVGINSKEGPVAASTLGEGSTAENERTTTSRFTTEKWLLHCGGSEENAYWEVRATDQEEVIYLRLVDQELANLEIESKNPYLTPSIEFMVRDLRIVESEGILTGRSGTDSVEKMPLLLAIIRRMLASDLGAALRPNLRRGIS
jgi:hypothetical protein